MNVDQTRPSLIDRRLGNSQSILAFSSVNLRRAISLFFTLLLVAICLGRSAIPAGEAREESIAIIVRGWGFDLWNWEMHALSAKAAAIFAPPAPGIPNADAVALVCEYVDRADEMRQLDDRIRGATSPDRGRPNTDQKQMQAELEQLRDLQSRDRPAVEQIIESQIGWALVSNGFDLNGYPLPPVEFTFTEPPKELVVSPRDRIDMMYGQMIRPEIGLTEIERIERTIRNQDHLSAYVTDIGGLGAFPTMVIDQASLRWILSTVAHEWTHNYLVFFPLGWNYFKSQDLTTMNETVADIVGNEIGGRVFATFYPTLSREASDRERRPAAQRQPSIFDFNTEMHATRLEVDRLLASGQIDEAEAYMEARRQIFVEHGYPLRVLNQAYFAFHGSYGASAASTSPIGPKLERLRKLVPDLQTFQRTIRQFTTVADLDRALAEWEAAVSPAP